MRSRILQKRKENSKIEPATAEKKNQSFNDTPNTSFYHEDSIINFEEDWLMRKKPVITDPVLIQLQNLLTKPTVNYKGSKKGTFKVYENRLNELKRNYNETPVQQLRALNFTRLQVI